MSAIEALRDQSPPLPGHVRDARSTYSRGIGPIVVLVYLAGTLEVARGSLYLQGMVLTAAIFGILAVSLDLVAGMTGLFSLGHAALFALGAYATALLSQDYNINVFVLLPISVVGVGLVGLVFGFLSLRVSGLYFAVTTFILTIVVSTLVGEMGFTGGPQGLLGPVFPNFPTGLSGLGSSMAWGIMLALLLVVGIVWSIRHSPFYAVLLAIRGAEPFAAAAGVNTSAVKVGVVALSASMAGLAGWAFSFLGVVSPTQFNWSVTVSVLVMVLLGGINTTFGPLIGAAIISIYPVWVNINPLWQQCVLAVVFIIVVVFFPGGIVGLLVSFKSFVLRLWKRNSESTTVTTGEVARAPRAVARHESAQTQEAVQSRTSSGARSQIEVAASSVSEFAVECRGIKFNYVEGVRVLNDVDFLVKRGTLHGLIGPNGSGKSTLVNLMAGRMKPDFGTIELEGRRVEQLEAYDRARMGVTRTFQSAVLINELVCRENVVLGLYTRFPRIALRAPIWPYLPGARRDQRQMREQSSTELEWAGAGSWSRSAVGLAPHGIQQLTQVASATVSQPSILILDEPFAGLSSGEVANLQSILSELRETGVSIVLIEHQTRVVFALCDEVTVLNAGEVIATGSAAEVFEDERVREVYLG
jgi:branched-chain amino acid transport system permease protein